MGACVRSGRWWVGEVALGGEGLVAPEEGAHSQAEGGGVVRVNHSDVACEIERGGGG